MSLKVSNLKGESGSEYIGDTSAHAGTYEAFQALTDCVINALISTTIKNSMAGATIKAGSIIYGRISSITLTSGTGMAYNYIPD